MKFTTTLLLVLYAASAHAELLAPQGAKGTLTVEYVFTSAGHYTSPAKDVIDNWSVRRVINLTAQYAADAPQPFGVLHKDDAKQNAQVKDLQARTTSAAKKMEPMANDMMAIAAKCGVSMESGEDVTKAQEACIEKAVSNYGTNLQMTPELKSAGADIAAVNKMASGTRFQLWHSTAQSGTYSIEENISKQVFEMTCTASKVCKRIETVKGGGAIPAPPGGKSTAGASMLEVDSTGGDMVLSLPMPLAPLPITRTVTTTIIDDDSKGGPGFAPLWTMPANKPITVKIPKDLAAVSGAQSIVIAGEQAGAGMLTVSWHFTRN